MPGELAPNPSLAPFGGFEYSDSNFNTDTNRAFFGPLGNYTSVDGIGYFNGGLGAYGGTIVRGGYYDSFSDSGVFCANLSVGSVSWYSHLGFRCASSPIDYTYHVCGGAGDSCYDDTTAKDAGVAFTPNGRKLRYVDPIWIEYVSSGEAKVLQANGFDGWQKKLTPSGRTHQTGVGSELKVDTTGGSYKIVSGAATDAFIKGRRCPTHVFYQAYDGPAYAMANPAVFKNPDMCLYYTHVGTTTQPLIDDTTPWITGLRSWDQSEASPWDTGSGNGSNASWYEGNITTCNQYGMRLPTLYETRATNPGSWTPSDVVPAPTFAGAVNGVPNHTSGHGWTWTASASTDGPSFYWIWFDTNAEYAFCSLGYYYVSCVSP